MNVDDVGGCIQVVRLLPRLRVDGMTNAARSQTTCSTCQLQTSPTDAPHTYDEQRLAKTVDDAGTT